MGCVRTAFFFTLLLTCSTIIICSTPNKTEKGQWQYVADQLKDAMKKVSTFFSNDIPHFFEKDIPEKMSEVEETVDNDIVKGKEEIDKFLEQEINQIKITDACECVKYSCGCCQHLEEPSIHLNSTLCANITYLSEDIGLSVTVTVNNYAIFNETVSVRNPPPVCLGVPYVKEFADACFRLYNIDATRTHFHACAQVEARMKHILIAKYELGCFDIVPFHSKSKIHKETNTPVPEPSVMLI